MIPRGDGSSKVLERVGDNGYVFELLKRYGSVSSTFNVSDLTPYRPDALDSRTNAFEDGGNDAPMTRSKDKQLGYDVDTFLYKHVQDEPSTRWIYLLEPMIV